MTQTELGIFLKNDFIDAVICIRSVNRSIKRAFIAYLAYGKHIGCRDSR
jgi:hypothetical protein